MVKINSNLQNKFHEKESTISNTSIPVRNEGVNIGQNDILRLGEAEIGIKTEPEFGVSLSVSGDVGVLGNVSSAQAVLEDHLTTKSQSEETAIISSSNLTGVLSSSDAKLKFGHPYRISVTVDPNNVSLNYTNFAVYIRPVVYETGFDDAYTLVSTNDGNLTSTTNYPIEAAVFASIPAGEVRLYFLTFGITGMGLSEVISKIYEDENIVRVGVIAISSTQILQYSTMYYSATSSINLRQAIIAPTRIGLDGVVGSRSFDSLVFSVLEEGISGDLNESFPNSRQYPAQTPASFFVFYSTTDVIDIFSSPTLTQIVPNSFDNNGVLSPISQQSYGVYKLSWDFLAEIFVLTLGTSEFSTLNESWVAAVNEENYTSIDSVSTVTVAYLYARGGGSDFSLADDFGRSGDIVSGTQGAATQAFDLIKENAVTPNTTVPASQNSIIIGQNDALRIRETGLGVNMDPDPAYSISTSKPIKEAGSDVRARNIIVVTTAGHTATTNEINSNPIYIFEGAVSGTKSANRLVSLFLPAVFDANKFVSIYHNFETGAGFVGVHTANFVGSPDYSNFRRADSIEMFTCGGNKVFIKDLSNVLLARASYSPVTYTHPDVEVTYRERFRMRIFTEGTNALPTFSISLELCGVTEAWVTSESGYAWDISEQERYPTSSREVSIMSWTSGASPANTTDPLEPGWISFRYFDKTSHTYTSRQITGNTNSVKTISIYALSRFY